MQNIRNLVHTVQEKVQEVTEKVTGHHKEGLPTSSGQQTSTGQPTSGQSSSMMGQQQQGTTSTSMMGVSNVNVEQLPLEKKFVIRTPNNPDCYLEYNQTNEQIHGKTCMDLNYIYVPDNLRNMGYGTKLVIEFLNWCRNYNYCVHVTNTVRPFLVDTVFNTNEFKSSGWTFNPNDNLLATGSTM